MIYTRSDNSKFPFVLSLEDEGDTLKFIGCGDWISKHIGEHGSEWQYIPSGPKFAFKSEKGAMLFKMMFGGA